MTDNKIPGLVFECYFETESGYKNDQIAAYSYVDFVKRISEKYPEDVGSDGYYIDPFSGEEKHIPW